MKKNTDALKAITNALGGTPTDGGNLKELKAILAALNDGELDSEAANAKLSSDILYRIAGAIEDGGGGGGGSGYGKTLTLTVSNDSVGGVLVQSSYNMERTQVLEGQTAEIPMPNGGEFVMVMTISENHIIEFPAGITVWPAENTSRGEPGYVLELKSSVNVEVTVVHGVS